MESVTFGLFAVQLAQKSSTSTRLSAPDTVGVNVWPPHVLLLIAKPDGLTVEFCAAVLSGDASWTTPGLPVRSQLAGTPRSNALCVLSVKQPLWAAALSVKFLTSVPPFGTT